MPHSLCDECKAAALTKALLSAVVGGVVGIGGGMLAAGGSHIVMRMFWRDRGHEHCARCGARLALEEDPALDAPPAAQALRKPVKCEHVQQMWKESRALTEEVFSQKPRDVNDACILPHIISALAGDHLVMFCRGGGVSNEDPLHMLHTVPEEKGGWTLDLNSMPDFGGNLEVEDLLQDDSAKRSFQEEAQARIAASLGVAASRVRITEISKGSVILKFTVEDLTPREKERVLQEDVSNKLRSQFNTFRELKISPAVLALRFDLDQLDEKGNKTFHSSGTFEIGPAGRKRTYTQPLGWARYGFKVLGKYDSDRWLHPFQDDGNWYRAYHGTGRSRNRDGGADAARAIVQTGFQESTGGAGGAGVYVSPFAEYSENGYCGSVKLETKQGQKEFKFLLQVAVDPDNIRNEVGANEWILPAQAVRPYGLLVKEA